MTARLKPLLLALGIVAIPFSATSVEVLESSGSPVLIEASIDASGALSIDANGLHLAADNRRLDTLLAELAQNSGIVFDRPEGLKDHPVTVRADAADWASIIRAALQGFNHVDQLNQSGAIERVIITGLNGDGADSATPKPSRFTDGQVKNSAQNTLPLELAQLPRDAVRPIRLDRARLMAMKLGEELPLSLPSGSRVVVHDNRYTHENGDVTWIGYFKDDGQAFRAVITFGKDGAVGQITAPEALFQIEPGSGQQQWLVDINAAGLSHSPHHGREPIPAWKAASATEGKKFKDRRIAQAADAASGRPSANPDDADTAAPTTVDLLVLYTPNVASGKAITRINQLIALANQAFVDSRIAMTLRLVKAAKVDYPETSDNSTALRDLTLGRGALRKVHIWRQESGADLVALIRPFKHATQKGCGSAWLNGADGSPLSSSHAFSVVNDGRSGPYFCSDYALAHELGHTMGSAHDRAHAGVGGVFPYSFGHAAPGSFGTIMSYTHPRLGLFSNPNISLCNGAPCGLDANSPAAADNASSLNAVRALVSGFKPAVR
jgi:hypothetical protein